MPVVVEAASADAAAVIPLTSRRGRRPSPKPVSWPELRQLQLSAEDAAFRRSGIGGSDANIILSGEPERVVRLWQEKRGEIEPENLANVLQVMLGSWTEAFNRQWYASPETLPQLAKDACARLSEAKLSDRLNRLFRLISSKNRD